MEYNEIETILKKYLAKEDVEFDKPTEQEWDELANITNCNFCKEFKAFIELMSIWMFPGDIYNVATQNNNGNDTILIVYNHELKYGNWNKDMVPFYGIGNGDYFCISALDPKVYYYYADMDRFEEYCDNFEIWINRLPELLE